MLKREAQWFGKQLASRAAEELFPMCNVGSASAEVFEREQPWINRFVFDPLRKRDAKIVNIDLFPGPGVDLAGDLMDDAFVAQLAALNCRSVFCSNVLEHVPDPARIAASLVRILPSGGWLFVSVPKAFPYHPDPIDTLFRPSPAELAQLFPNTVVYAADVIKGGTLLSYTAARALVSPLALAGTIRKKLLPGKVAKTQAPVAGSDVRPSTWKTHLPWLFRSLEVSCVVLRKFGAERETG